LQGFSILGPGATSAWIAANQLEDRVVAWHFGVSAEQVERKRRDLREFD
jgi:hypothetical protein